MHSSGEKNQFSEELWFYLLRIARRRYEFSTKHSFKNELPLHIEYMVLGELKGIRWLLTDLKRDQLINQSLESLNKLNGFIELQETRCKTMYQES